MSAPDTNLKKQERQHRAPLMGIKGVLALVAVLFLGYLFYLTGTDAPGAPSQGDPVTGAVPPDSAMTDAERSPEDQPLLQPGNDP